VEEYFSDILVYETSAGVVWKEDIKVGGKGVREDVVYRDATTSIKTDKTLMRQLKKKSMYTHILLDIGNENN